MSKRPAMEVLNMRQRNARLDGLLAERLDTLLPRAMRAAEIDMWIVACQEDNLDPVFQTLIPLNCWCPILSILIFFDRGPQRGVERINLSMTNTNNLYDRPWSGPKEGSQWDLLRKIIDERNPRRIGINTGSIAWAAGGLTCNLHAQLTQALSETQRARLVSAEAAVTLWGSTLTRGELSTYREVVALAEAFIDDSYSSEQIVPNQTTIDDLEWHYWQLCADRGIETSFKPWFGIFRRGGCGAGAASDRTIRPGDFLRNDVGLRYLRLCSDHQRWAYVPSAEAPEPPAGMCRLLAEANRLQDLFLREFRTGLTGNELLTRILDSARAAGIPKPKVYSHSLGLFLHQPGPLIGLPWEQERCPGRGDIRLCDDNCFAMELSVTGPVPEWDGQEVTFALEEPVVFTHGQCALVCSRQTSFRKIESAVTGLVT